MSTAAHCAARRSRANLGHARGLGLRGLVRRGAAGRMECTEADEKTTTRTPIHTQHPRDGLALRPTHVMRNGGREIGPGLPPGLNRSLKPTTRAHADRSPSHLYCSLLKATAVCLVPDVSLSPSQIFQNGSWRRPRRSTHDGGLKPGSHSSHGRQCKTQHPHHRQSPDRLPPLHPHRRELRPQPSRDTLGQYSPFAPIATRR